jgi:hypothetical protein
MGISVIVNDHVTPERKLKPRDLYGIPEGDIYIMLGGREVEYPHYFIGTGANDYPLYVYYIDGEYCIAGTDKEFLTGYKDSTYVEKRSGTFSVSLKVD